ncbi:MAG: D-alanyl-D-alanine carboxypeptidase/D-alanyl-D-alanine-endopeptidase [Paludibacteraceae bacterium]|nr:D-alanyl-D-alanine carboxypeptidase/D-alanyl-D-alanine-endopeptidase [Paludibacteraceae bacterium]
MRKAIKGIILSFTIINSAMAQNSAITEFVNSDNLTQASVGFLVKDITNGKVVAHYQENTDRNPASVTKIITTASAMEMLTDTFRFKTNIEYCGTISDSILHGDLYIRGGGDPTLGSAHAPVTCDFFSEALIALQQKGIKQITGHIVGDATVFREDGAPFHWLVEDIGSSYSPTPSGLNIQDNLLGIVISSDSTGISCTNCTPFTSLMQPKIEMTQAPKEKSWRMTKTDFSWNPTLRGNLPMDSKQYIKTEMPEPALFLADSMRNMLLAAGIEVALEATTTKWYKRDSIRDTLFIHKSNTLKEIERVTNYKSNNLYAECIFLTLSKQQDTIGPCVGWRSANVISKYWTSKGLEANRIFQVDGSGLSMKNAISPKFMVDVLTYMHTSSKYQKQFLYTLPTAGRNGTVASFMKGTALEGKAFVKSGSMERVQNYAGYINANGKWYAFCIMVSNFTGVRKPLVKQIATLINEVIAADNK